MKSKNIIEYISTIDGYLGDVCSDIYFLYLKENNQVYSNFQTFLEDWFDVESDKSVSVKNYYPKGNYPHNHNHHEKTLCAPADAPLLRVGRAVCPGFQD